ncbi:MAG TPA: isopeptide-forming domain-containing fimbrial protein [Rhizobiaceae bacterium]|nr:isopeptide-forming domain-containing fimbrial protein [Rhizobiaceae bacterium]
MSFHDVSYRTRIRRLEDRLLLNATPEAAVVDLPDHSLINESFTFGVTFDNTAAPTDPQGTGYGPFVDVTVGPGIDVQSIKYHGSSVQAEAVATWNGSQWVDDSGKAVTQHPLQSSMNLPTGTNVGETWLTVLAPFGSYTPEQPTIRLDFTAELEQSPDGSQPGAIPGDPIEVTARGGFQFGIDPLDNPSTDAPIQQTSDNTGEITPVVVELDKEVQLPESETAQGPNFPFTYTITADVATGVTLTDVHIQDLLPDNLYFLNATTNIAASSQIAPGVDGTAPGVPGTGLGPNHVPTTAEWNFASVTGQEGDDIIITVTAYAPERDASRDPVIDPDNPATAIATNDATIDANYEGTSVDNTTGGALEDSVDIAIRPYTVLKHVSVEGGGPAVPGKYLRYEVDIDVSDYEAFQDAVVNDVLSDGLTLDTTDNGTLDHSVVLQVEENGQVFLINLRNTLLPGKETELTSSFQADGGEALGFYLSAALRNNGYDDRLLGDLFDGDSQQGPTHLTLVYYAHIDENFREAGRGPVVDNDHVSNAVDMAADSATSGNPSQTDGSQSDTVIPAPAPAKSIYAVNGVLGDPGTISPGDEVTYRIHLDLSTNDVDNLSISDYLPSPVFDVDGNGTGFVFSDTQSGVPAAYTIIRGPDDTLTGASGIAGIPIVVTDGAGNAIILNFADFNEAASQGGTIDLLYTVTATDAPFADGLLLVNQAIVQTGNSTEEVANEQEFSNEVILHQPDLSLTKGAVATDANGAVDNSFGFDPTETGPSKISFDLNTPGFTVTSPLTSDDLAANPISSDLSGYDAGDTVKFAIVVDNTGHQDAFDVLIHDQLPSNFAIGPGGLALDIRYGDGTQITDYSGDLFGAGILIGDGAGTGSIAADGANDGHNIIIVTYNLVATADVAPGTTVNNSAELVSYAAIEGGNDFTDGVEGHFTDQVELTSQGVDIAKRLIDTDQDFTAGNDLTIGETGTFQIEVTVPDGQTTATIADTLPTGLALVGAPVLRMTFVNAAGETVTFSGMLQQGGVTLADGSTLAFTPTANGFTIDFSNILANAGAGTDLSGQTFAIQYTVQATDDPALSAGDHISNSATLTTPTTGTTNPVSAPVDIVEPDLTVTKQFISDTVQANDTSTMRLSIQNGSGTFDTTSFGLQLSDDDLPTDVFSSVVLASVSGTGNVDENLVTVSIVNAGDHYEIRVLADPTFAIAPGERLDLEFTLQVAPDVDEGTVVNNTATVDSYTSLSGVQPVERTFGPEQGSDTLTVESPTVTKTLIDTSYGGTENLLPGDQGYQADADPNVLVGEIVTYQLRVSVPRGVANDVVVYDDTDFLSDPTAQGIIQLLAVDRVAVGSSLTLNNGAGPTIQIVDTNGDGIANRLIVDFGTITNTATSTDPDPDAESIVLILRAQVMNVPQTDDGDVNVNGAAVTFTVGDTPVFDLDNASTATVTIHEPAIDVSKTATTPDSTTDAGDVVTYTLTLSHDAISSADGFALDLTDQLPAGMELIAGSATVDGGAPVFGLDPLVAGDVMLDVANNRVLVSGFDLGLHQIVTITYQARVANDVVAGQALTNTVDLTYKSLPASDPVDDADPSIAAGIPGAVSEARDGSDGGPRTDQSLLNNYAFETTSTVNIAVPGPISKTSDHSTYTIGDQIFYTIEIPVIEGMTVNPVLTDILPTGQDFIEGSGNIIAADGTVLTGAFTQAGQTLTLDGDTFITAADNNETNDFIRVTFQARVLNSADNNNGDVKVNTATFTSDNVPARTATASIGITEPDLVITKTNDATGPVDAGDVITYTVTTAHAADSSSEAFEYSFADSLPNGLQPLGIISATLNGVDVSDQIGFNNAGVFSLSGADLDIPLGASLVVVYQVKVLDTIGPNETIGNAVIGSWSSLDGQVRPGAADGERTGTLPTDDVNDYLAGAQDAIETSGELSMVKSVDADDTEFAVGEAVNYNLDISVFEGTLNNVVITDDIAPGLRVDLNSLSVVNVGFAGAAVRIVNPTLTVNAEGHTVLTFELDNDPGTSGSQIVNPGDPAGSTADNDTIRISYRAVVEDDFVNQGGVQQSNVASVDADAVALATGSAEITVVEPDIAIGKQITSPAGDVDAGDVIDYQVTLTNNGASEAYDVTFADQAPADTIFIGTVTAVDGAGATVGTFTVGPGGRLISGSGFDIAVGETVTITYSVQVEDSVTPSETLTNSAEVRWTSTPGANPDKRTGDDGPGPDASVLDNYASTASASVESGFADLGATKQLVTTSLNGDASPDVVVGETATFEIGVTVTEGTTPGVVITDQLTDGLTYIPGSVTVIAPAGTLFDGRTTLDPSAIVYDAANDRLIITLGTVTLPGSNDSTPGAVDTGVITLRYQGVVSDQLSNQEGVVLSNSVTATSTSPDIGPAAAGPVSLTVNEPDIAIGKQITSPAGDVDAGDVIDYQVTLTNNGASEAYDVTFADQAPADTIFIGNVTAVDGAGATVGMFTVGPGGRLISGSGFDIAVGETVTITYSVQVEDSVTPSETLTNSAEVRWTSTPGANPDERTGDDGPGPDASVLDNYASTASASVESGAFTVQVGKDLIGSSVVQTSGTAVAVGETATFRVRIDLAEGTTEDLALRDMLPEGQTFLPGSIQIVRGNSGQTTSLDPANAFILPGTNTLVIRLGDVVNPGDNIASNDFLDVIYKVVVDNNPSAVHDGATLTNTVTAFTNGVANDSASAEISVVEPELNITKTADGAFAAIGEPMSYRIEVSHTANSHVDAFDLTISDPFDDPLMRLDPNSITATVIGAPGLQATIELAGSGFRVTLPSLPLTARLVIDFQATPVSAGVANGATTLNTTDLAYDSIPQTQIPDEQRHYSDSDDAAVIIAGPDLRVVKDASVTTIEPGDAFSYTIQVFNKGAPGVDAGSIETARNVVLTDTLPEDVQLLGVTVNGVSVTPVFIPGTRQFSIDLGTLDAEQTANVVLIARLNDPLSPVVDPGDRELILINTATATLEQDDPTPQDNTDTAAVIPLSGGRPPSPDLVVTKTNDVNETGGSETVDFVITARNVGTRVAAGVEIVDHVDTNVFEFVSATDGGTFDPATGIVTWQRDTLSPDDGTLTYGLTLKVRPGLSSSIDETTNHVSIHDNGLGGADPTPQNNFAEHTDRLIYPDLVVRKTDNLDEVAPGDIVTYQITVENAGQFQADGVRVVDIADPRIFSFVSATEGGAYDPATGRIVWNLGTVMPGSPTRILSVTLEVLFPSSAGIGNAVNVVEVEGDGTRGLDAHPANNIAVDVDALQAIPSPREIAEVLGRHRHEFHPIEEEPSYVAPTITGTAAAGATVSVTLIGPDGQPVDAGSALVSASGQWSLTMRDFSGSIPVSAIVTTYPSAVQNLGVLDSTNVFFSPGFGFQIPFERRFDIYSTDDTESDLALKAEIDASENPFALTSRRYVNFNEVAGTSLTGY